MPCSPLDGRDTIVETAPEPTDPDDWIRASAPDGPLDAPTMKALVARAADRGPIGPNA